MSAFPVHSPIQRLNFDVLSYIFKMNADIFRISSHRALDTTLATSRVCRDWRNCMLSITSIWAHLIDLDHLLWSTAEGRRELVRRSGTALLWIKLSCQTYRTPRCMKQILDAVGENCERIQKLQVTVRCEHVDLWSQLSLPAPRLESLSITFPQEWTRFDGIFSSLFGGSAPTLHELRFTGHMSNFTPRPSWLYQLRSLNLSVKLTVSEMLEVLMLTKNLVTLQFYHPLADHTTSTLPLVSLPNLAHLNLELSGELGAGAVLLDHMCIPPACSVTISALGIEVEIEELDNKNIFAPIIRAISSCAQPHFKHHPPQQLWLTIMTGYFIFQTATHSHGRTVEFCVELNMSLEVFPMHTFTMLLSGLALPGLSEVTSFDCAIISIKRPVPGFTTFMTSLPSIETITTDKSSLRHLRAWYAPKGADGHQIGFPALKVLKLISVAPPRWHHSEFDSVPDPISEYVMERVACGHAINVMDFTEETLDDLPEMEFLRKAVGLKVRWRQRGVAEIREYICGTGPPQKVESV